MCTMWFGSGRDGAGRGAGRPPRWWLFLGGWFWTWAWGALSISVVYWMPYVRPVVWSLVSCFFDIFHKSWVQYTIEKKEPKRFAPLHNMLCCGGLWKSFWFFFLGSIIPESYHVQMSTGRRWRRGWGCGIWGLFMGPKSAESGEWCAGSVQGWSCHFFIQGLWRKWSYSVAAGQVIWQVCQSQFFYVLALYIFYGVYRASFFC